MERRLAALCRAVAVRVAENQYQAKHEKLAIVQSEKNHMVDDSLSETLSHDATALAHPPEMPIVIDETAIEDILGVNWILVMTSLWFMHYFMIGGV